MLIKLFTIFILSLLFEYIIITYFITPWILIIFTIIQLIIITELIIITVTNKPNNSVSNQASFLLYSVLLGFFGLLVEIFFDSSKLQDPIAVWIGINYAMVIMTSVIILGTDVLLERIVYNFDFDYEIRLKLTNVNSRLSKHRVMPHIKIIITMFLILSLYRLGLNAYLSIISIKLLLFYSIIRYVNALNQRLVILKLETC